MELMHLMYFWQVCLIVSWSLVRVAYVVFFPFPVLRRDCHRLTLHGIPSRLLYYWMMHYGTTINLFNSHRNYSDARSCRPWGEMFVPPCPFRSFRFKAHWFPNSFFLSITLITLFWYNEMQFLKLYIVSLNIVRLRFFERVHHIFIKIILNFKNLHIKLEV